MTPAPLGPLTRIERFGLAAGLVIASLLMWPLRAHVTDATFIHQLYAKNLAAGNGPVFNVGEHVYGCTSPLWAALIADAVAIGWDGVRTARVLGFLATLASVALFLQLMRRTLRLPAVRAFATVAWSAHASMIHWSLSGLETPLAVALTIAGFVAFTEGKEWGSRPVRTGSLWALGALTRPELVFLLILWGIVLLIDATNRSGLRRMVYGLVPPILIYGSWLLFARLFFHTFWPRTLVAAQPAGLSLARIGDQIAVLARTDALQLLLLAAALAFGGRPLWRERWSARRLLPWLWLAAIPTLYVARGVGVEGRYLLLLAPVLAWLAWSAAEAWWVGDDPEAAPRRAQATVFAFVIAILVVLRNVSVYRTDVLPEVRVATRATQQFIAWGRWFERNATPDQVIATPRVGAVAYFSRRRVLDLTGQFTPEMTPILRQVPRSTAIAELRFLSFAQPRFLMAPGREPYELERTSPARDALTPLGQFTPPRLGAGRRDVFSVYRVEPKAAARPPGP